MTELLSFRRLVRPEGSNNSSESTSPRLSGVRCYGMTRVGAPEIVVVGVSRCVSRAVAVPSPTLAHRERRLDR
jgi:hypothetical protein